MIEQAAVTNGECDYRYGILPSCAPLAVPFVPFQQKSPKMYTSAEALSRGTIYAGLDLPWKNSASMTNAAEGALGEVMALDFSINEIGLYLDTHSDDSMALKKYTELVALSRDAREKYVAKYGPIMQTQVTAESGYTWLKNPWPWDYSERNGD